MNGHSALLGLLLLRRCCRGCPIRTGCTLVALVVEVGILIEAGTEAGTIAGEAAEELIGAGTTAEAVAEEADTFAGAVAEEAERSASLW